MISGTNYLPIVARSEAHELAISYSNHEDGGWPWLPGSGCFEDHLWNAYADLKEAGLIYRTDRTRQKNGRNERANFRTTETGKIAANQLHEMLKHLREMQEGFDALIDAERRNLINRGT